MISSSFDAIGSITQLNDDCETEEEEGKEKVASATRLRSMPSRLSFKLLHCSGEDPDYPAQELLFQNSDTRGWQSPRFSQYPHKLIFELNNVAKIKQIQVLSHEFKIATKIEVYVGRLTDYDSGKIDWVRLGQMEFDTNERSNFVGRELKCAHVESREAEGKLILLLIHDCHINQLNTYNQVGVVAISILGSYAYENEDHEPSVKKINERSVENKKETSVFPLSVQSLRERCYSPNDFPIYDSITAEHIKELQRLKEIAVSNEDYDRAKELKEALNQLTSVGEKLAQLEAKKIAAVKIEDYDTAKIIKTEIEKIRAEHNAGINQNASDLALLNQSNFEPVLAANQKGDFNYTTQGLGGANNYITRQSQNSLIYANDHMVESLRSSFKSNLKISFNDKNTGRTKHQEYDDRPAQGKGNYFSNDMIPVSKQNEEQSEIKILNKVENKEVPEGFPQNLPAPGRIGSADAKTAEPVEELVGTYIAKCLFAKNWQLRDAAIHYIEENLDKVKETGELRNQFRTLCQVGEFALKDKIPNIYHTGITFIRAFIKFYQPNIPPKDIQSASNGFLPILIDKTGDSNARIREMSTDLILFFAHMKESCMNQCTQMFVRPVKKPAAWRPVLGRLELLSDLVDLFGVSKTGSGFELEPLMSFVGQAYSSANSDVRSLAIDISVRVAKMVGTVIRKYYPKDMNTRIKEQIEKVLESSVTNSPDANIKIKAENHSDLPHFDIQDRNSQLIKSSYSLAESDGESSNNDEDKEEDDNDDDEDPEMYEAEMQMKEKELGPDHPEVAEIATNLAMLYTQRMKYDMARPLLERVLDMHQKRYGNDHPNVAHALTDLAVLYLEQNEDELGKPLLERALEIQEKHLGSDHPDVIAIKDVLNTSE